MKRFLGLLAIITLAAGCGSKGKNDTISSTSMPVSVRAEAANIDIMPVNKANPFDSVGYWHNRVLDAVHDYIHQKGDTSNAGHVCMGTVDVNIQNSASAEEFIQAWESYFFNSYFSHLINEHNPINGNCVSLWKGLIESGEPFPSEVLKKTGKTLKHLLQ